jgi:hypothetical protein
MKLFEEISEHGIFHGITVWQENKPLIINDKNGLFIYRVGVTGTHRQWLALAGWQQQVCHPAT